MNPKTNINTKNFAPETGTPTDTPSPLRSGNVVPITTLEVAPEIRSLGQYLRSERERKRLSLEQIASATKISLKLLRALEDDRFELLPAAPFIRGFVTSYSKSVGIDPNETLVRYQQFIAERSESKQTRPKNVPHIFVNQDSTTDRSRTYLTIAMAAFGVLGLFFAIFIKPAMKRHKHRADHVSTQGTTAETGAADAAATAETATTVPTADSSVKAPTTETKDAATNLFTTKEATPGVETKTDATQTSTAKTPAPVVTTPTATEVPAPVVATAVASIPAAAITKAPATTTITVKAPTTTEAVTTKARVTEEAAHVTKTESAKKAADNSERPTAKAPEIAENAEAKKSNANAISPQDVKYKLVVRAHEDSWVKYQPDSRSVMGFTLKKDKMIYIRAKDSIRFTTGNPKGLEISVNNAPFESFKSGRSLILPAESADRFKDKMFTE